LDKLYSSIANDKLRRIFRRLKRLVRWGWQLLPSGVLLCSLRHAVPIDSPQCLQRESDRAEIVVKRPERVAWETEFSLLGLKTQNHAIV